MLFRTLAILSALPVLAMLLLSTALNAYALYDHPVIILQSSFVDSNGKANVVGTVRNYADAPVQVKVGLATADGNTLQTVPFGRTIWPLTDAPFKFVLEEGQVQSGDPFLAEVNSIEMVRHDDLVMTYNGMAVGDEKAFVGSIKNVGSIEFRNVSVYAAVHSQDHTQQLDSVRSNVIPLIEPGEEVAFTAVPNANIRASVLYYSCAGLDYDEPISTVKVGEGKILAYDLTAAAQIRNFRYENSTDSLAFGIRPYNPLGGDLTIKIPELSSNQTVTVLVDGKVHDASVRGDGRTLYVDFFVPEGDHEVQIQGVRNIPEMPYGIIALGAALAGLASLRFARIRLK